MNKISRAFRHIKTTKAHGKSAFPKTTLSAIQALISEGENRHRAEVRLIVEPSLDLAAVMRGMTSRERAGELFTQYRIWDTEENCGVLIYINLADHQVEIIADRGIARLIPQDHWQAVCKTMTDGFAQGLYQDSALNGLQQLNAILKKYFPEREAPHPPQANQLSNQPILL
ncbi:TPM domain-containing protein [Herminiimonas aquatilis]|uniref:TPM domain-containing protein n=1 Tax=Herminiimonas aquatilis TaxID=345342 RepID=A0ABW2J215_9BURK